MERIVTDTLHFSFTTTRHLVRDHFLRFYAFFFLPPITAAAVPAPQSTAREIQTVIWL